MRFSTLALLALASTTLATHAEVDACGVPEPRVFKLSSHWVRGADHNTRAFALLQSTTEGGHSWSMLAPGTYDGTQIAAGSVYGPAVELTLVGSAGTRRVSATDHVFIRGTWDAQGAHDAIEVDAGKRGDFRIAIAGADDSARFHELAGRDATDADALWLAKQGMSTYNAYVSIEKLDGTALEVITVSARNDGTTSTIVRSRDAMVEKIEGGRVIGGLTSRGFDYVLVDDRTRVRARAVF